MDQENVFARILRFLERNNLSLQEFVNFISVHGKIRDGVRFRYTNDMQSPFLLAQKTVNGIMIGQTWLGNFTHDESLSRENADRFRRNYAFDFKVYNPEKIFCRFPSADEATEIFKNIDAVNQKLRLLGKPLIFGSYWLSSTARSQPLVYDMDEGKVLKAVGSDSYRTLIIIDDMREL